MSNTINSHDTYPVMTAVITLLALYFLPSLIAWSRGHLNGLAIFVLNIFVGWTFIGWVGALVWSCTSHVRPKEPRRRRRQGPMLFDASEDDYRFDVMPAQILGESNEEYAERIRRLRKLDVLPPQTRDL